MRVISGSLKGLKLIPPKGLSIRPTPDKVKGAIFNIIGEKIVGCSFLDLFAGIGAIGIEALSRGAKEVVFVDNNIRAINLIKKNLESLGISGLGGMTRKKCEPRATSREPQIIKGEAVEAIKRFKPEQFDFIFLDPPYKSDFGEQALMEISLRNILKKDGEVIWEHYYKRDSGLVVRDPGLQLKRTIRYGDTSLSFFVHV